MRHIISAIVIAFGGFIASYTILSQRGILPPFWNISIGAFLTAATFIVGILLGLLPVGSGNLPFKIKLLSYIGAVAMCILLFIASWRIPEPSKPPPPLPKVYCSDIQQGQQFSLAPIRGGIGVTETKDGQFIGISDGSFAFDTGTASGDRPYAEIKCHEAKQFANDEGGPSVWSDPLQEPNDAEAKIYHEDQAVLGVPHVTLVVATMLTGNDEGKIGVGRDTLQGAYVAQHEYNSPNGAHALPNNLKVRILIANAGSDPANVNQVAQQIIQLASADKTFIGVIGWNFSAYANIALPQLNNAQIPMILPTASVDGLLKSYTHAFRITPTSKKEARVGADYIQAHLHAGRILLFVDYNDPFSGNLANDFVDECKKRNINIVDIETYRVGEPATLQNRLSTLLIQYTPDLIYFAGYPNDLITLANQLPQAGPYASLKVMGGDSLYEVGVHYPRALYKRLLFTSAAFPDVWNSPGLSAPAFFDDYRKNFDPGNNHPGEYGWSRADADSILAYDASLALLNGCANALSGSIYI